MINYFRNILRVFKQRPDISIILPIYNKAEHLEDCLSSILLENDLKIEVVCIDDASSDGSIDIVKSIMRRDNRIYLIKNKVNLGPGPSRNKGIINSKGKYLQFTDADDLLAAGALRALHTAAIEHSASIVRGGVEALTEGVRKPIVGQVFDELKIGDLEALREVWKPWYHVSYLFERELIFSHSIRYPNLIIGEDPVFLAETLCTSNLICLIPETVYIHRLRQRAPFIFSAVRDYVLHIDLVANIFSSQHQEAAEFYKNITVRNIGKLIDPDEISTEETDEIEMLIAACDLDPYRDTTLGKGTSPI